MALRLLQRSLGRAQRLSASSQNVWHLAQTPFKRLHFLDFVHFLLRRVVEQQVCAGLCAANNNNHNNNNSNKILIIFKNVFISQARCR